MNTFDLQIHSTASDGKIAPRDVVKLAKEKSILTVSLTDHDTVGGLDDAAQAGAELGVRVIPGIEISVEERGAHILGYGIDHKNPELLECLEEFKKGRIEGAKQMVQNLKNSGFVIEWEDVLKEATNGLVARPHIARAVINRPENKEKLAGISGAGEFIEKHLTDASPNYVGRAHIGAEDAIRLIKSAGGVAAWSHPAIHFQNDFEEMEKFLGELVKYGLQGVEVFSSSHSEDDVEYVQNLAIANNLLLTAGSDFHEIPEIPGNAVSGAVSIGDYPTYGFATKDIVEKLDQAMTKARQTDGAV